MQVACFVGWSRASAKPCWMAPSGSSVSLDVASSGTRTSLSLTKFFLAAGCALCHFHCLCETFAWSGFVRSAGMTFSAGTSVDSQLNWSTLCFQRQTTQALVIPAMKALLRDMASLLVGDHFKALLLWAVTDGLTCNFVLGVFSMGPVRLRSTLRSRGVGLPSSSITGERSKTSTCLSQTTG